MKPVLVLKQAESMPAAMQMAAGAPSSMSNLNPLALVPLPDRTRDPFGGRTLLAPQGAQYRSQYELTPDTPFGRFVGMGKDTSQEATEQAMKEIRALGHDPQRIQGMINEKDKSTAELEGFLENKRAKEAAKQSTQEVLAREMAQSGGNTQAAFQEALRRTGLGATAGKIGAGALAGLTGLMALQRANESGTDLISALGGAGAQGYSTYRYANPALQSLGMRGAAKISPSVGVSSLPTSPPADATQPISTKDQYPIQATLPNMGTSYSSDITLEGPTVAPPTVQKPQQNLYGETLSPEEIVQAQNALGGGVGQHMADASHVTDEAHTDHENALNEEEQKIAHKTLNNWDDIKWAGNRRSFVGVR